MPNAANASVTQRRPTPCIAVKTIGWRAEAAALAAWCGVLLGNERGLVGGSDLGGRIGDERRRAETIDVDGPGREVGGNGGGDALVDRRDDLTTVGPVDLVAVVVLRIVAGGDHETGGGAVVQHGKGDERRGDDLREEMRTGTPLCAKVAAAMRANSSEWCRPS
jgi:hypothetical protein